jgi:hypothetical protein
MPVDRGRGGRIGTVLALGGAIGLAAAIAGGGAVWWALGRSDDHGPEAPLSAGGSPTTGDHPTAPVLRVPTPSPTRGEAMPPGPAAPTPSPVVRAADPTPTPRTVVETAPPGPGPAAPERPTEPGPPAGQAADAEPGERVFVLEADLGYARLSLGYVIDRPGDPFAEVNGHEVHVGSTVDGFVVEAISGREVRLRDVRGTVVLRVR